MIGRALRAAQRPDTAADISARIQRNAELELLRAEMDRRFPLITADNVNEALAFQSARLRELDSTRVTR